jgi:hypothetical protein
LSVHIAFTCIKGKFCDKKFDLPLVLYSMELDK